MTRRLLLLLPLFLIGGCNLCGCTKIYQDASKDVSPTAPTPVVPVSHLVEFRVTGTVQTVTVNSSDTQDGIETIQSNLPWFRQQKIFQDSFLYLDASSFDFGQLHVQIYVDGQLFRESFATGFSPKVAISGQYRF